MWSVVNRKLCGQVIPFYYSFIDLEREIWVKELLYIYLSIDTD